MSDKEKAKLVMNEYLLSRDCWLKWVKESLLDYFDFIKPEMDKLKEWVWVGKLGFYNQCGSQIRLRYFEGSLSVWILSLVNYEWETDEDSATDYRKLLTKEIENFYKNYIKERRNRFN